MMLDSLYDPFCENMMNYNYNHTFRNGSVVGCKAQCEKRTVPYGRWGCLA